MSNLVEGTPCICHIIDEPTGAYLTSAYTGEYKFCCVEHEKLYNTVQQIINKL